MDFFKFVCCDTPHDTPEFWMCDIPTTQMTRFAIVTGRLEHNPAINLSDALMPHRVVHFPALPQDRLGKFLKDLDALNTTEQNRLAVRLLLHTAVRTGELRFSKWEHFELGESLWRIPAEYTKMKTEHIVPLSKQCLEILSKLKTITGGGEWLFPNQQGSRHPVMSENTINALIRRMGYRNTSEDKPKVIDCIVVTHGDADHYSGLSKIHESEIRSEIATASNRWA